MFLRRRVRKLVTQGGAWSARCVADELDVAVVRAWWALVRLKRRGVVEPIYETHARVFWRSTVKGLTR